MNYRLYYIPKWIAVLILMYSVFFLIGENELYMFIVGVVTILYLPLHVLTMWENIDTLNGGIYSLIRWGRNPFLSIRIAKRKNAWFSSKYRLLSGLKIKLIREQLCNGTIKIPSIIDVMADTDSGICLHCLTIRDKLTGNVDRMTCKKCGGVVARIEFLKLILNNKWSRSQT